jgi:AcrR family transcriptional regulator
VVTATARKNGSYVPMTQEDVLREAAELFCRNGYHKTRMQDIAARFGVTHAALYYHFKSKRQILEQINVAAVSSTLQSARAVAALDIPAADRLRRLLYDHVLWVAQNAAQAAAVFDFDGDLSQETLAKVRRMRREFTRIVTSIYEEGVASGVLAPADARLASAILLGAGNWVYRWYDGSRGPLTPEALATSCVELLEKGFLRASGRTGKATNREEAGVPWRT